MKQLRATRRLTLLNENDRALKRVDTKTPYTFAVMEEFALSSGAQNIGGLTMKHDVFAYNKDAEPIIFNKVLYTCVLLRSDVVSDYVDGCIEDTDYSLQLFHEMSPVGVRYCGLSFNRFSFVTASSQSMAGGNTEITFSGIRNLIE